MFIAIILLIIAAIMWCAFKPVKVAAPEEDFDFDGHKRYERTKQENAFKAKVRKFAAIPLGLAIVFSLSSVVYSQDPGESVVLQNWGGSLAGHSEDAGFHFKAPWQDTVSYDVRNNILSFMGEGEEDYSGGSCRGPQLTINDKGGASADMDVQVNYALDPSYVETLYADYGTQENFVHAICAVDIRATAREVAGSMDTITILTNRGDFSSALYDALDKKWSKYGINVEQVNVQDVRYPEAIRESYAKAQQAEIDKATALNQQEVAKTEADTKVEVAKREAEANSVLSASLTDEILRQQYIDALKDAANHDNLIVVPEGSTPLVSGSK